MSGDTDLEGRTVDVFVKVDPDSLSDECWENNTAALYRGVGCGMQPH